MYSKITGLLFLCSTLAFTTAPAPASADEKQPTKEEFIAMPARVWKHFQCAYLASMAQSHIIGEQVAPSEISGRPFMERGFKLGQEYWQALIDRKISVFDLDISTPRDFHPRDTTLPFEFILGQISIFAEEYITGEILTVTDNRVDYEKMRINAREKLETHGCDFGDLEMPEEQLQNYRKSLQSGLMQDLLNKWRAKPQ